MRPHCLWIAALVTGAALLAAPVTSAAETTKLGGSGSAVASAGATTMTLKGSAETSAETETVFRRYYARPYYGYRPYWGFPVLRGAAWAASRPFVWAGRAWYHRPYYGYYRPYYGYYRPYYGYYRPITYGYYTAPVVYGYGYTSGASIGYDCPPIGIAGYAADAPPPATLGVATARIAPLAQGEILPMPQHGGTYRYDGGPASPVPMPGTVIPHLAPADEPAATVPAVTRVAGRDKAKPTYLGYGEKPERAKPATASSVLVKSPGRQ